MEKLTITGQDHFGRGVSKINNKPIFIDKTLPGDIVSIEIDKETSKYMLGHVVKYHDTSVELGICPYYNECGGCHLLHQKYSEQLKFKQKKIEEIIKKFTKKQVKIKKIVYDREYNYRNKVVLHNLGFYKNKTNQVIDINSCMLADPIINDIIARFKNLNIVPDELMIRTTNQKQVMLDISGNISKDKILKEFDDIDVILLNNDVITKKDYVLDMINGIKFNISSKSFYQVNRYLTSKLYGKIIDEVMKIDISNALDLYCGTGTITLLLSKYVKNITGIEVVASSIVDANNNKLMNKINNANFICGKVEDYIEQFKNIDLIVVDPPRSGLDSKTVSNIMKIGPNTIIYVSCDPVTLARDLNILSNQYEINEITPFDMFPNTYHVECVAVLKLK